MLQPHDPHHAFCKATAEHALVLLRMREIICKRTGALVIGLLIAAAVWSPIWVLLGAVAVVVWIAVGIHQIMPRIKRTEGQLEDAKARVQMLRRVIEEGPGGVAGEVRKIRVVDKDTLDDPPLHSGEVN